MVAFLKQVTSRMELFLHSASEASCDTQHQPAERHIADLDEHMHVISHPAVRMQSSGEALEDFDRDVIEQSSVGRCEEDVLPMISSERYVIERAGHVNSKRSRHPCLSGERYRRGDTSYVILSGAVPTITRCSSRKPTSLRRHRTLARANRPAGFELCDAQKHCQFVDATVQQDRVVLDATKVNNAALVRYGWANSPVCNLYSTNDLPAVPFEIAVH